MKRFGRYDNDFNGLFECYARVAGDVMNEVTIHQVREDSKISTGTTYPGLKFVKIFKQMKGRGADMAYLGKVQSIDSDNGEGGVIMTATEGDQTIHVATTDDNADITVSIDGETIEKFKTTTPVRFDSESKELTIIQTEEV